MGSSSFLIIIAAVVFITIVVAKALGNSERKESVPEELEPAVTEPVYTPCSLEDALRKVWELFSDTRTADIVELSHDWVQCQFSLDTFGKRPELVVTYVFNENGNVKIPQYVLDRQEGDTGLYHIRYSFPEDKEVMERHLCEIMGITPNAIIGYYLWKA